MVSQLILKPDMLFFKQIAVFCFFIDKEYLTLGITKPIKFEISIILLSLSKQIAAITYD